MAGGNHRLPEPARELSEALSWSNFQVFSLPDVKETCPGLIDKPELGGTIITCVAAYVIAMVRDSSAIITSLRALRRCVAAYVIATVRDLFTIVLCIVDRLTQYLPVRSDFQAVHILKCVDDTRTRGVAQMVKRYSPTKLIRSDHLPEVLFNKRTEK